MVPIAASNPFSAAWHALEQGIANGLDLLHTALSPLFGIHAWGWAIIALTVVIRVLLLPLAVKQTRSMRAMQALQPRIKEIQARYKTDRDMMRADPQRYRERKQKMNEEVMSLYREEGVNPAAGCLPLLLQAPVFFALFRVLRSPDRYLPGEGVASAPFYVFQPLEEAANADVWGWLLIALMAGSMFWSQRQMMARNPTMSQGPQAQQQKMLMYVMPVFLAIVAQSLPIGVLLYWVTTNLWQMGQQAVIMREVKAHPEGPGSDVGHGGKGGTSRPDGRGRAEGKGTRDAGGGKAGGDGSRSSGDHRKASDRKRNDGRPIPDGRKGASPHLPTRKGGRRDTSR